MPEPSYSVTRTAPSCEAVRIADNLDRTEIEKCVLDDVKNFHAEIVRQYGQADLSEADNRAVAEVVSKLESNRAPPMSIGILGHRYDVEETQPDPKVLGAS